MPTASAITSNKDKDNKDSNNNTASSATATTTAVVSTNETNLRSAALERAYVHDVYENCEEPVGPIRPKVAQFLTNLDAGSLVCDVGCGNGRYLTAACNPAIYSIGVDRCYRLAKVSRSRGGEVRKHFQPRQFITQKPINLTYIIVTLTISHQTYVFAFVFDGFYFIRKQNPC